MLQKTEEKRTAFTYKIWQAGLTRLKENKYLTNILFTGETSKRRLKNTKNATNN